MDVWLNPYSIAAVQIRMYFDEQELSTATAFFWNFRSRIYLVTNWHNLSGRNSITNRHLSNTAAEPNRVRFVFRKKYEPDRLVHATIEILSGDGTPLWIEHPAFGRAVDIVALATGIPSGEVFCVNELPEVSFRQLVSQDVFILGFPVGLHVQNSAIWKKGTIASEPDIDADELPLVYVDAATISGMSGSPVLIRASNGLLEDGGSILAGPVQTKFIGVYSGRIASIDGKDPQLARVWKRRALEEIFLNAR